MNTSEHTNRPTGKQGRRQSALIAPGKTKNVASGAEPAGFTGDRLGVVALIVSHLVAAAFGAWLA